MPNHPSTRRHDVTIPTGDDRIEPTQADDIQDVWEGLMLSDLIHYNELVEPDDDPSLSETVQLSQYVTIPVLDPREPIAVPSVSPTPVQFVGRPLRPVPPLFAPGGTPPGPAELMQALRTLAMELIDHGQMMSNLSCRDEESPAYVARVLDYRSSDVSGVATRLGMLGRLFARLGVGGGPNGKGA